MYSGTRKVHTRITKTYLNTSQLFLSNNVSCFFSSASTNIHVQGSVIKKAINETKINLLLFFGRRELIASGGRDNLVKQPSDFKSPVHPWICFDARGILHCRNRILLSLSLPHFVVTVFTACCCHCLYRMLLVLFLPHVIGTVSTAVSTLYSLRCSLTCTIF